MNIEREIRSLIKYLDEECDQPYEEIFHQIVRLVNERVGELLQEIERLKSVEHTLCLTIGEADKAIRQSREENERLRAELEQVKAERDEQKVKKLDTYRNIAGWQERVYDLEAELSEKDKVLEWYADNDSYTVLHLGCSPMVMADRGAATRSILSRYKERGDSQNEQGD